MIQANIIKQEINQSVNFFKLFLLEQGIIIAPFLWAITLNGTYPIILQALDLILEACSSEIIILIKIINSFIQFKGSSQANKKLSVPSNKYFAPNFYSRLYGLVVDMSQFIQYGGAQFKIMELLEHFIHNFSHFLVKGNSEFNVYSIKSIEYINIFIEFSRFLRTLPLRFQQQF